ncbi:hypothetical protein B9Z55_011017 [Caenorhabditis nigoni]|uniref:Uncharacterized protein n=1 Tax=Caenorhabditis nigoni TaxID=1611254 RepID=A0A2G5UJ84_9PELO|nr:hypothetical protein B9Z55_011017 [Caenorhabditis nigoni]
MLCVQSSNFTFPCIQRHSTINVTNIADIQKQQLRATMAYYRDIYDTIEQSYASHDPSREERQKVVRATKTKSLDYRAKTAITSKAKMVAAVIVNNNIDEQFKADNELIRRLTDNRLIDDDVQDHLLEETNTETKNYAEVAIAKYRLRRTTTSHPALKRTKKPKMTSAPRSLKKN